MTDSLLALLVLILLFAVTLNIFLTIRIASIIREAPEPQDLPFTLGLNSPAPPFSGRRLIDGVLVSSEAVAGAPTVLVFLSSACADCRKKLPELVEILPAMHHAGVELLVLTTEGEAQTRRFLGATPLFEHVVVVDKKSKKILNPRNGAPFYIFVDDQNIVKASNFIGDQNWRTFMEQMREQNREMTAKAEYGI